jgi:abortive infection bacteriophage resistance protein
MQLYVWNGHACGSFYLALQTIEVAVRNASHHQLSILFGESWFHNDQFLSLDEKFTLQISQALVELRKHKYPTDSPHVVSILSFGFWTMLYSKKHESQLWAPKNGLRRAFPRTLQVSGFHPSRKVIADRLHHLRMLRNRIAHHEPVFQRDLHADYSMIKEVTDWMHEVLPIWIEEISGCRDVLLKKPRIPFGIMDL